MFFKKSSLARTRAKKLEQILESTFDSDSPIHLLHISVEERIRLVFSADILLRVFLMANTSGLSSENQRHIEDIQKELTLLIEERNRIVSVGEFIIDQDELRKLPRYLLELWNIKFPGPIEHVDVPLYVLMDSMRRMRFAALALETSRNFPEDQPVDPECSVATFVNLASEHTMKHIFEISDAESLIRNTAIAQSSSKIISRWVSNLFIAVHAEIKTYT